MSRLFRLFGDSMIIPFSLCTGTLWIVFPYVLEIYSMLNYANWYMINVDT
jgi:hypothetical protein